MQQFLTAYKDEDKYWKKTFNILIIENNANKDNNKANNINNKACDATGQQASRGEIIIKVVMRIRGNVYPVILPGYVTVGLAALRPAI